MTPLSWALVAFVIITATKLKTNGLIGYLKGFCDPIFLMAPFNLLGEIFRPVSMAFRHFGNVAGGGVITSILYLALSSVSNIILTMIAKSGIAVGCVLLAFGIVLVLLWKFLWHKAACIAVGVISGILGLFGLLQATGILSGVPVLAFGIPAVLSCYFDFFSGFVQAYVFSLLTMVYISAAIPAPEKSDS